LSASPTLEELRTFVEEELDELPPRRRTLLDRAKAQLGALGDAV
jgi:hypothetical protein